MRIDRRQFLERQLDKARAGSLVYVFVLAALSTAYRVLVQTRSKLYGWGLLPTKRLPFKVVCVGNITMGGTGKTPMVEYIACALKSAGVRVAVLSRGYRGKHEKGLGVVSDGKALLLSGRESGDEPYLLARRLKEVPVLVGRDRYKSGEMAHRRFHTQVAILDDGYQHIQLERDMNILLVDGREGFGTAHVFPLGSLREPLTGLSRADHILITKTERTDRIRDIEKTLRRWNSGAEIFHGRTVPEYLLDPKTGQRHEPNSLQGKKVFAFAGLATPEYFFELLRSLGAVLVGEIVFPDHHRYSEDDLDLIRKITADAEWCVTTEKDIIRLADLNCEGLPIKVLQIRTEISRQKAFEEALFRGLEIKRMVTPGQRAS